MAKWEYKIINMQVIIKAKGFTYTQDLKDGSELEFSTLGKDGWELVSVMPIDPVDVLGSAGTKYVVAFFKRQMSC